MGNECRESHMCAGYQWEATLFLTMWDKVEARYGADAAREICGNVLFEAGVRFGRTLAQEKGRNDLAALKETWEELYPTGPDTEWDGKRLVVHSKGCVIKQTFALYQLPPEKRRELGPMFCAGDRGFVHGFNPDLVFTWGGRLLCGDPECIWIMESPSEGGTA